MNASNLAMQAKLLSMMAAVKDGGFQFSKSGLHYLACRANGVKYRKAMLAAFEALLGGTLKADLGGLMADVVEVLGEDVADEAIVILATGRRPQLSRERLWGEEQISIVDVKPLAPEMLVELNEKVRERLEKARAAMLRAGEVSKLLLEFFTGKWNEAHPVVEVVKEAKPKAVKEAKPVVAKKPMKKKVSVQEVVAEINEEMAVAMDQPVMEVAMEPIAVEAEEPVKKPVPKKKKSAK